MARAVRAREQRAVRTRSSVAPTYAITSAVVAGERLSADEPDSTAVITLTGILFSLLHNNRQQ